MSLEAWLTLLILGAEFALGIGLICYAIGVVARRRRLRSELERHPIVTYFEPSLTEAEQREMERWED